MTNCAYFSNGRRQTLPVLGIYEIVGLNRVEVEIKPIYKVMILSFNLIRTSWTPFSDLLKITLNSKNEKLNEYIIDYERREEIDDKKSLIRCNNIPMVGEKFYIQFPLNNHNITRLKLIF